MKENLIFLTCKPDTKIMGEHIKKEYSKYLGVLIDKTFSWTNHIKHANLKISMGKAILRRYVSKDTLRTSNKY